MDPYQIIIEPIITEKALMSRGEKKYVFKVHQGATKVDIKSAIYKLFKVKPIAVNTVKVKGKSKRLGYKPGHTPSYKKAYVVLAEGQKIEELEV